MPNRCVVYGCDSTPNPKEGVFLFGIPFFGDERPEAKRRRKAWVKFVDIKRKNFTPSKGSSICSKHFVPDDFTIRFTLLPGHEKPMIPRLKRDEVGICVFPTLQSETGEVKTTISDRKKRKILKEAEEEFRETATPGPSGINTCHDCGDVVDARNPLVEEPLPEVPEDNVQETPRQEDNETIQENKKSPCGSCRKLRKQRETWKQRWKSAKVEVKKKIDQVHLLEQKVLELVKQLPQKEEDQKVESIVEPTSPESDEDNFDEEFDDEEPIYDGDDDSTYNTETESEEDDQSEPESHYDILMSGKDLRTEPKHIVFLSQLQELFKFCHSCKADGPLVEARQVGTEVVVTSLCQNPACQDKERIWHSQPTMKYVSGQRGPAGNFLLSMAILFAGGSPSKVMQIFSHMGLGCTSLRTFFNHQKNYLFPIIHLHWKMYQESLLQKVNDECEGKITVAGDARHDSMGHNAKYGAYSVLCSDIAKIIHFSLVQRNQADSSNAMEYVGFKNCMEFLLEENGLPISTFVSDRHTSICSHMKKELKDIKHYFDLWHLKKKIRKVLVKLAKEKNCEVLKTWIKPCENHLYWSAMSTQSGKGDIIWAKFKSFLSHVVNKHDGLDEPLFNKCGHGQIRDRTWLEKGSVAHDKMVAELTKASLIRGIKQASPLDQTSGLEGFHSVVNFFAPKMIAFSYVGMYCRHILAILHFNSNAYRDIKYKPDGTEQVRVSYPKFKYGEATVRNVRVAKKFDYIDELYGAFLETTKEQIHAARDELKNMTPRPMNSVLEKQPIAEAVQKRLDRLNMVVRDVPATASEAPIQRTAAVARRVPKCSECGHDMKGHKYVTTCLRNMNKQQ